MSTYGMWEGVVRMWEGVVREVLVPDHDTEAPGAPAPVATRIWGLGWFSPWSFSWESIPRTLPPGSDRRTCL